MNESNVVPLRRYVLDLTETPRDAALAAARQLLLEADDALNAALSGDLESVFRLRLLVNRAIGVVDKHGLATCPPCWRK